VVPNDTWGIDSEGLTQDNKGNWWICDEYGTSIYQLDASFRVIRRFTPFPVAAEDVQLDTLLGKRRPNRGLEGIAYTPNGKIYAIIQSPASNPNLTVGNNSRIHRLVELDPETGLTRTFVYVHDPVLGEIRSRDWKIGDLTAVNNEEFLVLEHAERNGWNAKNIYSISLSGATPVVGDDFGGLTLEQLNDGTGLAANGIVPVSKSLFADLLELGWERSHDKPEGLTVVNDSTFAVVNDNDYGINSPSANGAIVATGKTTKLYVYTLPSNQKLPYVYPYCTANLGNDFVTCGDLEVFLELGGQGFTQATWADGNTDITRLITTPDTYAVTAINEFGCTASDTITIGQSDFPVVDLGASQALCSGNTISLDAGVHNSYTWNNGDSSQTILVTQPGGFSVSVTNDAGCEGVGFVFISSGQVPVVNLPNTQNLCSNQVVTLDAGNTGALYLWSTGDTTQTTTATTIGAYALTVTSADGCTATDATTLVASLTPDVQLGNDISICSGQAITLESGYPGANILWSNNATTPNIAPDTSGTYSVVVTFINGCSDADTVEVLFKVLPVVELGADTVICDGQTLTLSAGSQASYQWSNGATSENITIAAENVYGVTVTNSDGCTATDDVLVTVEICSETKEPSWAEGTSLFPNPTSGLLTLKTTAIPANTLSLSIFNNLGQEVISRRTIADQETQLDLTTMPKGMYQVRIFDGARVKTWAIVVQ
jgi:hypothetical protein